MEDQILFEGQNQLRLIIFVLVFLLFAGIETIRPLRKFNKNRLKRWANHLGLIFVGTFIIRLILPIGALFAAKYAQEQGIGILSLSNLPFFFEVLIGFITLDLAIYTQHVVFHKVSWLWRLHRVHHYDTQFDVSTAVRFHPLEILLSQGIKIGVIVAIGAPLLSVFLFEIILSSTSLFNHSNINVPKKLDTFLRLFVVTPDMHRIHHSIHPEELQSNFGFNLPVWDHLFKTYKAQPKDGQRDMTIGLKSFRDEKLQGLKSLLLNPFIKGND